MNNEHTFQQIKPGIFQKQLKPGVELFVLPRPQDSVITVEYAYQYGSVDDEPYIGVGNIVRRASERKAGTFKDQYELMTEFEKRGAVFSSAMGKENHSYTIELTESLYLPEVLNLLHTILYEPQFTLELLQEESTLLSAESQQMRSQPRSWVGAMTISELWRGTAYQYPASIGDEQKLAEITVEQLHATHQAMRSVPMVIGVSGPVTVELVTELLQPFLHKYEITTQPVRLETLHAQTGFAIEQRQIEQSNLWIAFAGPGFMHQDYWQLVLADYVLGKGFLSRFYKIRTEHSLAYYFTSTFQGYQPAGFFGALGGVPAENVEKVFAELWVQIRDVTNNGFTDEEIAVGRNYVLGVQGRRMAVTGNYLSFVVGSYMSWKKVISFDGYVEKLKSITSSDLQAVVSKYLVPEACVVGSIGPLSEQSIRTTWQTVVK